MDTRVIYATSVTGVTGSFRGFYDTATVQSYAAAVDGLPRNLFLYPAAADSGQFFTGLVLPDYALGAGVTSAVALTVTWSATGPFTRSAGTGAYGAVYAATYA